MDERDEARCGRPTDAWVSETHKWASECTEAADGKQEVGPGVVAEEPRVLRRCAVNERRALRMGSVGAAGEFKGARSTRPLLLRPHLLHGLEEARHEPFKEGRCVGVPGGPPRELSRDDAQDSMQRGRSEAAHPLAARQVHGLEQEGNEAARVTHDVVREEWRVASQEEVGGLRDVEGRTPGRRRGRARRAHSRPPVDGVGSGECAEKEVPDICGKGPGRGRGE